MKSYDRANSKKVKKGSVLKQRKTHDNLPPNLPTRIPMKLSSKFLWSQTCFRLKVDSSRDK